MKELTTARKEGTLTGFHCETCGKTWVSPIVRCAGCGGTTIDKVDLPKEGKVLTFTIQNVAAEEFMNDVPYAWAIITLNDGTNVTGWIPYIANENDLKIGDRVKYTPTYKPGIMFEKS